MVVIWSIFTWSKYTTNLFANLFKCYFVLKIVQFLINQRTQQNVLPIHKKRWQELKSKDLFRYLLFMERLSDAPYNNAPHDAPYNNNAYIMLLNFVKLSTLLIEKGSHKRFAMPTVLVVVWALWSFKIFIWSELRWWALKERNSCCPQIDLI